MCNLLTGDMLRVMSGGLYQPTPHRVINTSGSKTRTSVAFFYEPVRPAPSCACAVLLCSSTTSTAGWSTHCAVRNPAMQSQIGKLLNICQRPTCHVPVGRLLRRWCSQQQSLPCPRSAPSVPHGHTGVHSFDVFAVWSDCASHCPKYAHGHLRRASLECVRYGSHLERKVGLFAQLLFMRCTARRLWWLAGRGLEIR